MGRCDTEPSPPGPIQLADLLAAAEESIGDLTALPGDVSQRRYYRGLRNGVSVVVAWYPPNLRAACTRFLRTSALLCRAGVPVPEVIGSDCNAGWMLLEDAGSQTLFELASPGRSHLERWIRRAAEIIPAIQAIPVEQVAELSPPLDGPLLAAELRITWELFLEPNGLVAEGGMGRRLRNGLEALCHQLAEPPLVPCHRDFMARNLVPAKGRLVVLDHQDLRLGPRWYDLASLLNDSLAPDDDRESHLCALLGARGPDYQRAAAQRTLKAIGTFCRFARSGNRRHLPLVAQTWRQARRHLADLPELSSVVAEHTPRWAAFGASPEELAT